MVRAAARRAADHLFDLQEPQGAAAGPLAGRSTVQARRPRDQRNGRAAARPAPPLPPVATLAAAWAPPTMTPGFRTKANIKPPSRASSPPTPIAVPGGPTAPRLRFAFRCVQRQAHAERNCQA